MLEQILNFNKTVSDITLHTLEGWLCVSSLGKVHRPLPETFWAEFEVYWLLAGFGAGSP
jgi:hypothetical protein